MENINYQIKRNTKSLFSIKEIKGVFNDWVRKLLPIGQKLKNSQRETQELESNKTGTANSDAVFIGWQKTSSGKEFALYNVTAKNHPLYQSTVSDQTLRNQNLKIPETPPFLSYEKRFGDE